jgi:hypothetical protein
MSRICAAHPASAAVSSLFRFDLYARLKNSLHSASLGLFPVKSPYIACRNKLSPLSTFPYRVQQPPMAGCLATSNPLCGECPYCQWVESGANLSEIGDAVIYRPEAARVVRIYGSKQKPTAALSVRLQPAGLKRRRTVATHVAPQKVDSKSPEGRLMRFLRLLSHMGTAPWANVDFSINRSIMNRLVASHLHLIVGKTEFKTCNRPALYALISPTVQLDGASNLIWITNRQNGKTSTLGRFIAALAVSSPTGGSLSTIYSTSLDRAVELKKAALQYVHWLTGAGKHSEFENISLVHSNYTSFSVRTQDDNAVNLVTARPKNPDSCRGDAPESCFFDEIGFMAETMWWQFAYPLLQVGQRVFTCTTTPPPQDSFFDVFTKTVKDRNKEGDNFFLLINHSLACTECIEALEPERCCHQLHLIPPWKSLLRFNAMKALVPSSHEHDFATEVYGVLRNDNQYYFPAKLLDKVKETPVVFRTPQEITGKTPIWIAIDPASHDRSEMGLAALIVTEGGAHTLIGASTVSVARCQSTEVQMIVRDFINAVRQHDFTRATMPIVPIVECNNNEVMARSILAAFSPWQPVIMPFTKDNYQSSITPHVGVWCTHTIKMAMIQQTYQVLLDNRLAISGNMALTGRGSFDPRSKQPNADTTINTLFKQLGAFKDQPDGKVSGCTAAGDKDDLGIAFMMTIFWSVSVRSAAKIALA